MLQRLIRLAIVVGLAAATLNASTQAKLGLYQPVNSAAHLSAARTKLFECRIERVAPEAPVEPIVVLTPALSIEPHPVASDPNTPRRIDLPRRSYIRPPPASPILHAAL